MIDQTRLKELEADFGAEDLGDLIEVFLAETWEGLEVLEALIEQGDAEPLRDQFHFLKGCARNIGAAAFADSCESYERSEQLATVSDLRVMRSEFQAVCDWFSDGGLKQSA